ncbi:stage V sporulation protein AA [Anaerosolibacter carboniphilus]|uniref:Stage V sporulation protein AA n=1 Tax=Anaerosolibacter carboniphilus TaxID=1417629 RepID=A0A841KV09_9FIRM|nr:stage V sporulation protein AA [Anaerosolibacter carboniphilus]MBB6216028.1 stage V sporulation protein AA [Anaerosolibacter carboniphilus]
MISQKEVYIQLKDNLIISNPSGLKIKDIAIILTDKEVKEELLNLEVLSKKDMGKMYIVVSILTVVEKIRESHPDLSIIPVGESELLVKIENDLEKGKKFTTYLKLGIVAATLFVGTGLAIMNFHADVNMGEAHKVLYRLITGNDESRPLILQIPYSFGIGLGMALFFNHFFPKHSNEPSPMEVEMYLYKQNMDEYLLDNEKNTEESK